MNDVLIICPVGKRSCHKTWMNEDLKADTVLICFEDDELYSDESKYYFHMKGMKWNLIAYVVSEMKDILGLYKYVWLPDDDIKIETAVLNRFFKLVEKYDFALSQPALTENSYCFYETLLEDKDCIYRTTNFIEIMIPFFRIDLFNLVKGGFFRHPSGFGFGQAWYWENIAQEKGFTLAIVDETPAFHTQPVGGNYPRASSIQTEARVFKKSFGVEEKRITIFQKVYKK